ncbi:family 78 glycoside hydrolase catalytic domain [Dyadobacter sp. 3J3]|uniref:family 78 glycoside hydrolase catalytic domain n=1 Tax=Dyadobacter sp. 3J3 TaxID=2606600 RepID=UPI00135AA8B9|nr:family 78 glycoside hydrolase catalytic domain [Dyadobacter sp. 3J3]
MHKFFNTNVFCLLLVLVCTELSAQVSVSGLKCDYELAPIGIQTAQPYLGWILQAPKRNTQQTAYRVIVADQYGLIQKNTGNIWDSKKVLSSESHQIKFSGKKLVPVKQYFWKVMVWDNHGEVSTWSAPATWQMGLLSASDWQGAQWIGYNKLPDSLKIVPAIDNPGDQRWNKGNDTLPLLRKSFKVNKKIKKATAFVSGLGQFEMSINGDKIGDHFLDPGWTQYDKHALYVTFDLTEKLKQGMNALGVMLGNGFYFIPGDRYHKLKGAYGYPKMICRIVVQYQDGSYENIVSDESWKTTVGPITYSSIYGGQDYNATLENPGWNKADFDDRMWQSAIIVDGPGSLESQTAAPLKIFDEFTAVKITQPKPGVWVYDMGQNASGIPRISVKGKRGEVIKITPAELIYENGFVNQSAVGAPVYFNYVLSGNGVENWQPQFMYYGFRYIQIEGGTPENESNPRQLPLVLELKSLHTRNSAPTVGTFSCSNVLFNKTFKLIDWAIKSNMASILTDCPHREKLGWLEEAYLVGSSIRYTYDIAALCRKIVRDMIQSQTPEGLIPDIAPEFVKFDGGFRDSPEWGSNAVIMPYYLYKWYKDTEVLAESYDMMTRYATYLGSKSRNHLLNFGLGDWYDLGPKDPGASQLTPGGITSTATYYYDLKILAEVASILGKNEDARKYTDLSLEVKNAYNTTFFNKHLARYGTGSQTANAISVYMGLAEEQYKERILENIIRDIKEHGNGVTAGDIGYRYLLRVLDDNHRSDLIYDMNSRSDVPGYGLQLAKGATSLTESWQGNTISSNNHFMLGHLMEWFYSGLGGIKTAENSTAFSEIVIRPEPVGDVSHAKVSHLSNYGMIKTDWEKSDTSFRLKVQIPVNTTAVIYLPADEHSVVKENGSILSDTAELKKLGFRGGKIMVKVGSGSYSFSVE